MESVSPPKLIDLRFAIGSPQHYEGQQTKVLKRERKVDKPKKDSLVEVPVEQVGLEEDGVSTSPLQIKTLVPKDVCETIEVIPIFVEDKVDSLIWHHDPQGSYTIKSGYHNVMSQSHMRQEHAPSSSFRWTEKEWKFIWSLNVLTKLRHFLWHWCNIF
ncbi:hypothetical protein LOK49_LG01G01723 [Camellia lanceoleosa]|uniref:Uncharacterized protein n=1 Tax=Camellia lanceoleosa TaxID=1840588 RepID=A0ACC0IYH6_9ERIC|nr:hypothetical protein LOK49_LG01G01723 [Camellia lanceoleosa]